MTADRLPGHVAVVGGGRWARVICDVLAGILPAPIALSVHSRSGAERMAAWIETRGLAGRIAVSPEPLDAAIARDAAVVVVNRAADHVAAAVPLLARGLPVLVEKPLATTEEAASRLIDLAERSEAMLAVSQVFRFTRYLPSLVREAAALGDAQAVHVEWRDPAAEERYSEAKHYDPGLTVYEDCLPHIVAILETLAPGAFDRAVVQASFLGGGRRCEITLTGRGLTCTASIEREAQARARVVRVMTTGGAAVLDASVEPGTITAGARVAGADPDWNTAGRPLAMMLTAFLGSAGSGTLDPRLHPAAARTACRLADETRRHHKAHAGPWLSAGLSAGAIDDDLRYALAEALQARTRMNASELETATTLIRRRAAQPGGGSWLARLANADDPFSELRHAAGLET